MRVSKNLVAAALPIVAIAALSIGCGDGEESEKTQEPAPQLTPAERAMERYVAALEAGDGAAACEVITKEAQREALEALEGTPQAADSCPELSEEVAKGFRGMLSNPEFETLEETADTATVQVTDETGSPLIVAGLSREDGDWKISGAPSP